MNDLNVISANTQVTLLLCGKLGAQSAGLSPLTDAQYNLLAMTLCEGKCCPADLIGANGVHTDLVQEMCARANERNTTRVQPLEAESAIALLRRGFSLGSALEKWQNVGIHVVGRGDPLFPKRLREHLRASEIPPLLYYAGNAELFAGGGMAFVGSRDLSEEATNAIRIVAGQCVKAGMNVVSGGARGADQTAMQTAYAGEGRVIGALSGDLIRTCLLPENRDALSKGQALLFSNSDPSDGFSRINAMVRNKFIYAMADAAFVAQSDTKGGTWSGATEELKRTTRHPLYVYVGNPIAEGNQKLLAKGALSWQMKASFNENLAQQPQQPLRQSELGL